MFLLERRNENAMTLVEMLVAISIIGIAGAGIAGLMLLYTMTTTRVAHKVDNVNQARQVMERISRDVRMSRNLGDAFGTLEELKDSAPTLSVSSGSSSFPAQENPFYGSGEVPPAAFGGWPSSLWPARPYVLSPECLILQIPVFYVGDDEGFPHPRKDEDNMPNVDTVIYHVIADPANAGQYMLEVAGFPGNPTNLRMRSNPVDGSGGRVGTVLKGIVGPLDPVTKQPKIFQYLLRTDPTGVPYETFTGRDEVYIANATGVVINLEILRQDTGAKDPSIIPLRTETYLRNNVLSY